MPENTWRIIPHREASGAFHMAADVYFAQSTLFRPVLRFYSWNPYAISLGYHQDISSIDHNKCMHDQIQVIRRPTGGRAILHAEELTYSVVLPREHPVGSGRIHEVHNVISGALKTGLSNLDIPLELQLNSVNLRQHYRTQQDAAVCFSSTTRYELQLHGKKVIGSAQRQFPDNILQHGSILLGSFHKKLPEYLNLSRSKRSMIQENMHRKTTEIPGDQYSQSQLSCALKQGFTDYFQIEFEEQQLTLAEIETINDLQHEYLITSDAIHS